MRLFSWLRSYIFSKDTVFISWEQADLNIVEKVSRLVCADNSDLLNVTVRLLLNLSFDAGLRAKMIKVGLLPKLVALIREYWVSQFISSSTVIILDFWDP